MELRPAWRQTDLSQIPSEWGLKRLGQLYEFSNGVNADKGAYGHGMRFVNVLEPITFSHLYGPEIPGLVSLPSSIAASYAVKQGDVLFNRTSETDSEVGLACVYQGQEPVVFGGFVIRGRPIDSSLDSTYAGYALRAPGIRAQIIPLGQGAVRANIGQQQLRRVVVPIPPTTEQHAIAAALSDVDAELDGLTRLIAKKRDIKQAAMQQLLTGRTRLQGFGGSWEVKRLGQLGSFLKGSGIKKNEARGGTLPCVRYGELYTDHHDVVREFRSWITRSVALQATRLRKGDLLFAGSGETKEEIGKCAAFVSDVEAYAGGDIVILRPSDVDSTFMGYSLNAPIVAAQKASRGQGDAVVHISASALASISLAVPPLEEQTAIATVISDMDAELAAVEARRAKTQTLKQAMMQELLTGRIRLVSPELAHG